MTRSHVFFAAIPESQKDYCANNIIGVFAGQAVERGPSVPLSAPPLNVRRFTRHFKTTATPEQHLQRYQGLAPLQERAGANTYSSSQSSIMNLPSLARDNTTAVVGINTHPAVKRVIFTTERSVPRDTKIPVRTNGAAQQVVYITRYLPKTGGRCITQLAKMSIDPNFVGLTDDVRKFYNMLLHGYDNAV